MNEFALWKKTDKRQESAITKATKSMSFLWELWYNFNRDYTSVASCTSRGRTLYNISK